MSLVSFIKNRYVQAMTLGLAVVFVLGSTANAATLCLANTGCTLTVFDYPFKMPGYLDLESEATVSCVGTKRVFVQHMLQKKNSLGLWVTEASINKGSTNFVHIELHYDCTNDKLTTWRTQTRVTIDYGKAQDTFNSSTTRVYCGS